MIFSQFFGEPIACDAGEVRDISFLLMLMLMLMLWAGKWRYWASSIGRLLLDVLNMEYTTGSNPFNENYVRLKVYFQEYKGACTGGDQVLVNMINLQLRYQVSGTRY